MVLSILSCVQVKRDADRKIKTVAVCFQFLQFCFILVKTKGNMCSNVNASRLLLKMGVKSVIFTHGTHLAPLPPLHKIPFSPFLLFL